MMAEMDPLGPVSIFVASQKPARGKSLWEEVFLFTRSPDHPVTRKGIKIDEGKFSVVKSLRTKALRIFGALAMALCVVAGTLPAQRPGLTGHIDPKARQMLDRAIQALGGQAFLSAKSLTTKGRVFFFRTATPPGWNHIESWVVFPDKRRFSYGKTKPVILINNGDKGWELDRYGLISQPDQQLQGWIISNRYSLENMLRLRINEPGVLIQIGKVDFVDNVPTQGIEIIAPGGTSVRLDLHRQTLRSFPHLLPRQKREGRCLG